MRHFTLLLLVLLGTLTVASCAGPLDPRFPEEPEEEDPPPDDDPTQSRLHDSPPGLPPVYFA